MSSTGTTSQPTQRADTDREENFGEDNEDHGSREETDGVGGCNRNDGGSFVEKIRTNFSCMFSKLLPVRFAAGDESAVQKMNPSLHTPGGNESSPRYERPACLSTATQTSAERNKRPRSPDPEESDENNNNKNSIAPQMPTKRRCLHTSEVKAPGTVQGIFNSTPAAESRRPTGSTGRLIFHNRLNQLRSGNARKSLFGSPCVESLRDGRNNSVASTQRPSFKPSVTRAAKSLTSGYTPPEIGGSPFYKGYTRYGGASAAETLDTYVSRRPTVTTLIRKKQVPDARDALGVSRAGTREANRGILFSPARARINSRQTPEQRQHKYPPIVPLMDFMPPMAPFALQPAVPILPKDSQKESEPTGGKLRNKLTRLHAQPLKEPNVPTVAPYQLPNVQLPPLKELPKFDFSVPLKGPALPVADTIDHSKATASDEEIISLSDDEEETQEERENITNGSAITSTPLRVIDSFVFAPPLVLGDYPVALRDIPVPGAIVEFTFSRPEPLHDPTVEQSSRDLSVADTNWECDVCIIRNEPHQQMCITCQTPIQKTEKQGNRSVEAHKTVGKSDDDRKRSSRSNRWKCPDCKVRNESTVSACVLCGKPNKDSSRTSSTQNKEHSSKKHTTKDQIQKDRSSKEHTPKGSQSTKDHSAKHHSSKEHAAKNESSKDSSTKGGRTPRRHSSKEHTTKEQTLKDRNKRSKSSTKDKPSSK